MVVAASADSRSARAGSGRRPLGSGSQHARSCLAGRAEWRFEIEHPRQAVRNVQIAVIGKRQPGWLHR